MKKFYALVAAATISASAFAQTTIYSEDFGNPAATTPVVSYTGYKSAAPVTYSGSADVRSTSPSSGYTDASGNGNVFFGTKGANLVISGINTSNYDNIQLSFGELKSTNAATNELTVEVSTDGTNWSALTYNRASGSSTANNYVLISPIEKLPATSSLSVRFTNTSSTAQWRVDDVKIVNSKPLGTSEAGAVKNSLVKNTAVKNSLEFGAKSDVKIINMNGQVVKSASVESGSSLDVSGLAKGMYIVTGVVNGEKVSQKIIKN